MHTIRLAVFSLALVILFIGRPSLAAPNPPEEISFTVVLPAGVACSFDVEASVTGKDKVIDLPGGRFIFIAPKLFVTLTNLEDPSKQVTLNATGSIEDTINPDGSIVSVFRGRSVLTDPVTAGLVLVIGNFSYVSDAEWNIIQPIEGKGQIIDICPMID
jgi:hypothetical protein